MDRTIKGENIAPTPESANPIAATGQTLDSISNAEITVSPGVYVVTAVVGYVTLGLLTQATEANILWATVVGGPSIHVAVPAGTTTLNYKCTGSSPVEFLRKVYEN